jgi:hypothetical protein
MLYFLLLINMMGTPGTFERQKYNITNSTLDWELGARFHDEKVS